MPEQKLQNNGRNRHRLKGQEKKQPKFRRNKQTKEQ